MKKNLSWSPSGDTRGLLKPLTFGLYIIKIYDFQEKTAFEPKLNIAYFIVKI